MGSRVSALKDQMACMLAVLILIGTLAAAALIPGKQLAVAVAVAGTFLGTALLSVHLPRLFRASVLREQQIGLSKAQLEQRLTETADLADRSERRALVAEREIARLETMRIDVAALNPILNLGLLEVETRLTDFQRRIVGDEREEAWWRNGYRQTYLGVLQLPIKAQLGIDLSRVRVSERSDGSLVVSGITMTAATDTTSGPEWLLDEIRTEYLKEQQVVKFKGDAEDPRAKAYSRDQEAQLRRRLQEGQDFKVFESGLVRSAERFLRVLLGPTGRPVHFEAEPLEQSRELTAYLVEYNQRLDRQVADLKTEVTPPPA